MTDFAQTWIVRVKKNDWDRAEYGSPIQTLVAASTPEEARAAGAALLGSAAADLECFQYQVGSNPEPPNPTPLADDVAAMRGE